MEFSHPRVTILKVRSKESWDPTFWEQVTKYVATNTPEDSARELQSWVVCSYDSRQPMAAHQHDFMNILVLYEVYVRCVVFAVKFKDVLWAHVLWAIRHVYIICWVIQHKNMQLCLHRSCLSFFHLAHGDAFAKSGILLEERSCSVWPLWQEPYSHMRSLHAPRYHRRPNVCAKHASQTSLKLTHQQKAEASTLPNY